MGYTAGRTLTIGSTLYRIGDTLPGADVDGWPNKDRMLADGTVISTGDGVSFTPVFSAAAAVKNANGNSGSLAVDTFPALEVGVNVSALSGTNPTITFVLEEFTGGNWVAVWSPTVISATTAKWVLALIGAGKVETIAGVTSVDHAFASPVRLKWTIGGTAGPSATVDLSVVGLPA